MIKSAVAVDIKGVSSPRQLLRPLRGLLIINALCAHLHQEKRLVAKRMQECEIGMQDNVRRKESEPLDDFVP